MKQEHVESVYGKPNFKYFDEDENIILGFNSLQSRLTFYADEDFRLGYITSISKDLSFFETNIVGKSKEEVLNLFKNNKVEKWETEILDGVEMLFNEDNWVFLHFDYNELVKVEIGAVFNNQDEFDWKFKS